MYSTHLLFTDTNSNISAEYRCAWEWERLGSHGISMVAGF